MKKVLCLLILTVGMSQASASSLSASPPVAPPHLTQAEMDAVALRVDTKLFQADFEILSQIKYYAGDVNYTVDGDKKSFWGIGLATADHWSRPIIVWNMNSEKDWVARYLGENKIEASVGQTYFPGSGILGGFYNYQCPVSELEASCTNIGARQDPEGGDKSGTISFALKKQVGWTLPEKYRVFSKFLTSNAFVFSTAEGFAIRALLNKESETFKTIGSKSQVELEDRSAPIDLPGFEGLCAGVRSHWAVRHHAQVTWNNNDDWTKFQLSVSGSQVWCRGRAGWSRPQP